MSSPEAGKIEHIKKMRKFCHQYFKERSEVYRKLLELEVVTFRDGALSKREKELISIGVSDDGTLAWLLAQVRVAGMRESSYGDPVALDAQWAWLTL